jgi:catechol-2,3-dioxygenase
VDRRTGVYHHQAGPEDSSELVVAPKEREIIMRPKVIKLVETSIYVSDLERSESFYTRVLGLEVFTRDIPRDVFLKTGRSMFLIFNPAYLRKEKEREGDAAIPQVYEVGKTHIAFEIDRNDFEGWKDLLSKNGVTIEHEKTWENEQRSIYFRDPDGNVVELVESGNWPVPPG